jgi:uncharacterized membrane protein (DUF106 family)
MIMLCLCGLFEWQELAGLFLFFIFFSISVRTPITRMEGMNQFHPTIFLRMFQASGTCISNPYMPKYFLCSLFRD